METYKIHSIDEMTTELIYSLIKRYKTKEVPRIKRLKNYYLGKTDIKKRLSRDPHKPNNRIDNNFAGLIVDTVQGYFLGKPVAYSSDNEEFILRVQEIYDKNHEQTHNSKIGKMLSITGIAYELLYMNEQNEIHFSDLDPEETFIIYDNSIKEKPLAGIRFYDVHDYVSEKTVTQVEVYTSNLIQYYEFGDSNLKLMDEQEHYFGDVPVICYVNNFDCVGDFEKVISLINAYDVAVSDSVNNVEYFADAYLVLKGIDMDKEQIHEMKENRVMILNGQEGAGAEWLTKSALNMEMEELKNRLKDDIHTFSQVPDINAEHFSNAVSGEALKYRIFSLENFVSSKERLVTRGLEKRIKLITEILNIFGASYEHTDIVMKWTRNLPQNVSMLTDMVQKLQGIISNSTLVSLLPFVEDPAYELQLLKQENEGSMYEMLENPDALMDQ